MHPKPETRVSVPHHKQVKEQRTQSNAFDSLAHTSGHSNGVIVASDPSAMNPWMSSSRERLRFCTGSVVEEQLSQDEVRDLNEPVYAGRGELGRCC